MKIAVVGSRNLNIHDIGVYLPKVVSEIVSGGSHGIDTCASIYAREKGIKLIEFLPEYKKYGKAAPIIRNKRIVEYADRVLAFWDGKSKGTLSVIKYCEKLGKECEIILINT